MAFEEYDKKLAQTIERLSDPSTYNVVCHEHRMGEPLPSIVKLQKIIDMVREILFPGYFGDTSLRPNTTRHYMGVYVVPLRKLLIF
jgi:serine O-acetyltransferase